MGKVLRLEVDERIARLRKEVRAHPKLQARIDQAKAEGLKAHSTIFTGQEGDRDIPIINDMESWVGYLAAEVGILLAATYTYEDICQLCDVIRQRLEDKRTTYINSADYLIAEEVKKHGQPTSPDQGLQGTDSSGNRHDERNQGTRAESPIPSSESSGSSGSSES